MTASRNLTQLAVTGLAIAVSCCLANAVEPDEAAWPDARRIPAFRAPEEVPDPEAVPPRPLEPAGPLTLADALSLALMHNPELAVFSWETRVHEARKLQAGKFPNPELDIRLWELDDQGGQASFPRRRILFSQDFEFGDKSGRRKGVAEAERQIAEADYQAKRDEIAARVTGQFITILGAQLRVKSLRKHLDFLDGTRDNIAGLVESGSVRRLAMHQVNRRHGLARLKLEAAESALSAARFGLVSGWGGHSPRFTEAVGDLEHRETVPDIETVLEIARQRPTVARWDAELARGEAAVRLAKSRRVPDLTMGFGFRWEDDFDRRDYLFDIEIALPIFDRKQGEIREAHYGMARARAGRQMAETTSNRQVAELYYRLSESEARRTVLGEEVLPATRATFDALLVGFDGQMEDPDDLLDARRNLTRAEIDYTEALVAYHDALAALESILGQSFGD